MATVEEKKKKTYSRTDTNKHKVVLNEVNGIEYKEGIGKGVDVRVGALLIPNVSIRSLRDVRRQLKSRGCLPEDIKETEIINDGKLRSSE